MNVYAGIPDNIRETIEQAATKALESQIEKAIRILTSGKNGEFEAVVGILKAMIGQDE